MSFNDHFDDICKALFCRIRVLRRIRPLSATDVAKAIVTVVISSGLDYCNVYG
jgi:hypothetical protein